MPKKRQSQPEPISDELMEVYRRVDQWVRDYQNGNNEVSTKIVDAFEGYLVRYFQILAHGNFDNRDPKSRRFLGLFIKSPYIRAKIHFTSIQVVLNELNRMAQILKAEMSVYTPQEIWHELVVLLLDLARRYRSTDGNPRFHNYVDKTFPLVLAARVRELTTDPLIFPGEWYDVPSPVGPDSSSEDMVPLIEQIPSNPEVPPVADEEWIEGKDVSDTFKELIPLERRVLVWRYLDRMTYREIGAKLGIPWKEARSMIQEAVAKIRDRH